MMVDGAPDAGGREACQNGAPADPRVSKASSPDWTTTQLLSLPLASERTRSLSLTHDPLPLSDSPIRGDGQIADGASRPGYHICWEVPAAWPAGAGLNPAVYALAARSPIDHSLTQIRYLIECT